MAIVKIPTTPNLPHYNQFTTLDGVTYQLVFFWNVRDEHWFMDIFDINGNAVLLSTRLVCNFPLLRRANPGAPPGQILAVDTSGVDLDPLLDDLGTRVELLYYDLEEIAGSAA